MKNGNFYNPSFENQYLESDMLFEDGELGDHELILGEEETMWEATDHEDGEDGEYGMMEGDQFFGGALKAGFNFAKPFLRPVALKAAQHLGGKLAGQQGARFAHAIASQVLREAEAEGEYSYESEGDPETLLQEMGGDMEVFNEMAHYANLAAETDNEAEADQFIGAIANLAGTLLPQLLGETDQEYAYENDPEGDQFLPALIPLAAKALPMAMKAAPLIRTGIQAVGKLFRRGRRTRRLIKTLPNIATRTAVQVARQAKAGRRVTPRRAMGTLVQQTTRQIASPARVQRAMRTTQVAARRARHYQVTVRPMRPRY